MKNLQNKKKHVQEDYDDLDPKGQFRSEYSRKKETQKAAKDRRQWLRETKEERDWWK